jgi:NADPH:quinone reductase-like Zn-dependent oxidoreductase
MIGEHDNGTNAEYFVAPVTNVLEVGNVDPVEAASFGLAHLTAWRMLITRAQLRAGHNVLITGIGGGAALAAFNICKHFGCHTIVTSRHQWKLDKAIELGASEAVLDDGEDWSRTVRGLTGKRGVDVCVDSVGGQLHHPCIKSLARGGTLVTCGCTAGAAPKTDLARIFWNQLSVLGSTMGDMDEFREVLSLFKNGMKPIVDSIHDVDDASTAFARLESGEQFGKIVLRWH